MKIVHFITSLKHGGAEKLLTDLLPRQKALGVTVCLVSVSEEVPLGPMLVEKGITLHTLAHRGTIYQWFSLFKAIRAFHRLLKTECPDIVHSHIFMADIIARLAAPRGMNLMTTLHNIDPWWAQTRRIRSVLKTRLDAYLIHLRDVRIIACSEIVRRTAISAFKLSPDSVRAVYNGVDIEKFHPAKKRPVNTSPTIIQVGNFYPVKGHTSSLKALEIIKQRFPNIRLILVGDGWLRPKIEQMVQEMNLADSVEFLGLRDDIPQLLRQADIYWMPSLWEGLSIAMLEAMACGLPVVATNAGGIPETVEEGITGYLVDKQSHQQLAQKTLELINYPELALNMGRAGRRKVEQEFTISKTAADYVQSYCDIAEQAW